MIPYKIKGNYFILIGEIDMNCTYCDSERVIVIKTINEGNTVIRNRKCKTCNRYFTTIEILKSKWDKLNSAVQELVKNLN